MSVPGGALPPRLSEYTRQTLGGLLQRSLSSGAAAAQTLCRSPLTRSPLARPSLAARSLARPSLARSLL